jgi:hypothetical protein
MRGDAVELHGEELVLRARRGRALIDECSMILRELFAHAGRATWVGRVLEVMADHVRSHSETSHKVVEQLDQIQAGNIQHRATGVAELAGKHTLINGGELVKADAGQIHLG